MAVKLYTLEALKEVGGLYPDKALAKMNGDIEVYSALLDKFLNQTPRTIPKLKQLTKDKKISEYANELKDLRIDLADIYALDMLERANKLFDTAEKGDAEKCAQQLEPFLQLLQTFSFEIKQCRTQDGLADEEGAVSKASELDIGSGMINNKYSTVNKAKFIDLYGRIDGGLIDKAINLTNVLKAMGYDAELSKHLLDVSSMLENRKQAEALAACKRLLTLLGCKIPAPAVNKFTVLLVDSSSELKAQMSRSLGSEAELVSAVSPAEIRQIAAKKPDFILINSQVDGMDGIALAGQLKTDFPDLRLGFIFAKATPQDIIAARNLGVLESFLLPLNEALFVEKMKKYMK